jgi:hypothetical protein
MITSQRAFREFDPSERLYCDIAVGILGAGALGAGATIFGASKAADAQTQAAQASIANQQQMYAQNRGELQPFISAGQGGIQNLQDWLNPNGNNTFSQLQNWVNPSGGAGGNNPLSQLMRLTTPGADMSAALAQTPGYQFALGQGLRASNNQLAARGLGGSGGAVAKGADQFATGLAGNTWQSVVQALQNTFNSGTTALQGTFGTGAGALQNLVNSGVTAGSSLAGVGTNTANAISGSQIGAGSAQAAGYNAIGTGISQNAYPSGIALAQLLGGNQGGNPTYGGGNIFTGVYGGSSSNPLPGLSPSDYGEGF